MTVVTIPGEPVAQGRPRFARRGAFVSTYDPPKSRSWKSEARTAMMDALEHPARLPYPQGVALSVSVLAVFSRPKSAGKKPGRLLKVTRPDAENVAKAVDMVTPSIVRRTGGLIWTPLLVAAQSP